MTFTSNFIYIYIYIYICTYRILEVAIRMPLNKTKGSAFKLRWGVCGGTVSPLQLDLGEMFHFKQLGSLKDGF